jgi:basic membrane protein A
MKHIGKVLILVVLIALFASACQPAAATETAAEPTAAQEKPAQPTGVVKAALILPGVISDAGWNAAAYDGLMAAKDELGVEVAYSESVQLPDFEATFRDYASQGYNIVIGHGSEFGDAALTVAKEFPDTDFAVTNSNVKAANVAGLDTKNEETGYMAGFIAGTLTTSKTVGYVGAMEIVAMKRGEEGYRLGVAAACPDCEVLVSYVGSFDDIAKGKETALGQIDKGADVMFAYADAAGLGVLEAAQDKGILAIGSGYDQKEIAPKAVVVSCLQKLAPMIVSIVKEVQDGTFKPNEVRMYGYDTGAYDLTELDMTMVTQEQADKIYAVRDQLKAGQIELPHLTE